MNDKFILKIALVVSVVLTILGLSFLFVNYLFFKEPFWNRTTYGLIISFSLVFFIYLRYGLRKKK
ncbi:hypothetical protein C4K46_04485 [Streptococcus oricebi]|uniref:Bacteriocin immunity protein n=2 Tax=Streptococcus oricebi TaxID=1547447 RepID=A0ABS5B3Z3_9STRE|nr:hypothetical protein [Streptococcus oricebi]